MGALLILLQIVSFVCWLIVIIDAFRNEIWKGVVALLCGFYALYYGFAEFQHERKGLIMGVWVGSIILGIIVGLSRGFAAGVAG